MYHWTRIYWMSARQIREALPLYPGLCRDIVENVDFKNWCMDAVKKLEQLDDINCISGRAAIDSYLKQQAIGYAIDKLKKMGNIKSNDTDPTPA